MGRLIDADALKKDFNLNFGGVSHAAAAAEIIDRQPTIDPESLRPRAHWIPKKTKFPRGQLTVEECSLCEDQQWNATNFCPCCGAKMEG